MKRQSPKKEVIFGFHPVIEALAAGKRTFYKIHTTKQIASKRLDRVVEMARSRGVIVDPVNNEVLKFMTGTQLHQGVCASVSAFQPAALKEILQAAENKKEAPFIAILDGIVDPNNLGAIVRTALCAGVHGIVVPKDRAAGPTPVVSRASAGALEHALFCRVTNIVKTLDALKSENIWVAGLDMNGDRTVFSADLSGPVAVVVGGEGKGIRPLVKKHCDYLVSIPQKGPVDSLNASVASAVILYEVFRKRTTS